MTAYFGECQSDGSLIGAPAAYEGGANVDIANIAVTYTCPGTGTQNIVSIAIYGKSAGGAAGNVRCAIYDASWNRICQWNAELSMNSTTAQWWEKLAAALTGTLTLTGGTAYKLVFSTDADDPQFAYNTGAGNTDWEYDTNDYTGGFPAAIDAPANAFSNKERFVMRVGTTPAFVPILARNLSGNPMCARNVTEVSING